MEKWRPRTCSRVQPFRCSAPAFHEASRPSGDANGPAYSHRVGAVAAAPQGSAGILPIPWAYLRMMGPDGLTAATATAVLAANYVAVRLKDHFPVLYAGGHGLVMVADHRRAPTSRAMTTSAPITASTRTMMPTMGLLLRRGRHPERFPASNRVNLE